MNTPDLGVDALRAADSSPGHDPSERARLRQLVDEQAALRRVATLVAGGAQPAQVFTAVADELSHLIGAEATFVSRVDHPPDEDGELEAVITVQGSYGTLGARIPVGFQLKLLPEMVQTAALRTGRPARGHCERLTDGAFGEWAGTLGVHGAVATPVMVRGCRWGVALALTSRTDFPAGAESHMAQFMELAAAAIASAEADQGQRALADTEAALRRLATLVARGEPPEAVFAAATTEVLRRFGGGTARMIRFELDGTVTLVANDGAAGPHVLLGGPWEGYPEAGLTATVLRTGRSARVDDYRALPGGEPYLREGLRSAIAVPVHVDGRLWGMIAVGSGHGPLPPDAEQRMAEFTGLVATAVANAQNKGALEQSRDELARLLAEQAALRRVATLVARGVPPETVFGAVVEEVVGLLPVESASLGRFESDGTGTVMATAGRISDGFPVGSRWPLTGRNVVTMIFETGRPARIDGYANASGPLGATARAHAFSSGVGTPVIVEGRLWGMMAGYTSRELLPADTEARLASFTELVATAIANAESRAALAASRARIVAAADETRRRIERDLHDGIQQRLVTLGLELRATQVGMPLQLGELEDVVSHVADGLASAFDELREISHGIHPAILSEGGLDPALRALCRRSAVPVELDVHVEQRLPEHVEVAAYYVVSEALTNAAKHAHASVVKVELDSQDASVHLAIRDDGIGGADLSRGSGLLGLRDRIEALSGTLRVTSPDGAGTALLIDVPIERQGSAAAPKP